LIFSTINNVFYLYSQIFQLSKVTAEFTERGGVGTVTTRLEFANVG